jgi:hypothetical protein
MQIEQKITQLEEVMKKGAEQLELLKNQKTNSDNVTRMAVLSLEEEHDTKIICKKFIESKSKFCLITAPPQVGKTDAIKDYIDVVLNINENIPIIISCDNKTNQLVQIESRLNAKYCLTGVYILKTDKKLEDNLTNYLGENKKVIILCLDNPTQIKKVRKSLIVAIESTDYKYSKMVLFHDEADVTVKDCDVDKITDMTAKSQKEWVLFKNYFNKKCDLKIVFVSATPEACCKFYDIKPEYIVQLKVPSNYIGIDKLECHSFENANDVLETLEEEIRRRITSNEKGSILLCIDRKVEKGHFEIFEKCKYFQDVVVHTYNGDGITARIPEKSTSLFEIELSKLKNVTFTSQEAGIYNSKDISIRDFYTICNSINQRIVVTIGMDLIARGISYVSNEKEDQLCATTLIYRPGSKLHNVAICQAVGRICGCVRNDLTRRLIAPESVIADLKNFSKNQQQYLLELKTTEQSSKEIMNNIIFDEKLTRGIDRPNLKIKFEYKSEEEEITGEIDGVNLKKLSKWSNDDSLVGKMVRFLYDFETPIDIKTFMEGIEYQESTIKFINNIDNGRSINCQYGKLWSSNDHNNSILLNHKIRDHLTKNLYILT